ncbi:MAG TPA: O-antigen translocase, partial [Mariniflexile sp.]
MKKIIDYINKNVLIKVTSLQAASVLTRIIAGILTSKAIAVFIGPTGLALIGNLRNFVSSFQTIAILGFYNGAVRYISDFKDDVVELSK